MKNFKLIESDLRKLVRLIIEETENESESEVVKILPTQFLKLFKYTNSVDAILNQKNIKIKKS